MTIIWQIDRRNSLFVDIPLAMMVVRRIVVILVLDSVELSCIYILVLAALLTMSDDLGHFFLIITSRPRQSARNIIG